MPRFGSVVCGFVSAASTSRKRGPAPDLLLKKFAGNAHFGLIGWCVLRYRVWEDVFEAEDVGWELMPEHPANSVRASVDQIADDKSRIGDLLSGTSRTR